MWHAHMQDNQAYKADCLNMLKRVLNHVDDFSQEELEQHQEKTKTVRGKLFPMAEQQSANYHDEYPGYSYIYYGGGVCGAGGWEFNHERCNH